MSAGSNAPSVTFVIMCFNQEEFVQEAIEGAFAQTYPSLQIILSDDCSSDESFEIMKQMAKRYAGPHEVSLNRNKANLGLINHVNKIFYMVRTDIVVLAAGDDVSLPERTSSLYQALTNNPSAKCAHSAVWAEESRYEPAKLWEPPIRIRGEQPERNVLSQALHIGASAAYRKAIFSRFGPIVEINTYEDLILGFRALIDGGMTYVPEPLVNYRGYTGMSRAQVPKTSVREDRVRTIVRTQAVLRQRLLDLRCLSDEKNLFLETVLSDGLTEWAIRSAVCNGSVIKLLKLLFANPNVNWKYLLNELIFIIRAYNISAKIMRWLHRDRP